MIAITIIAIIGLLIYVQRLIIKNIALRDENEYYKKENEKLLGMVKDATKMITKTK